MNYQQKLRDLREDKEVTQKEVAEYLGITQTQYHLMGIIIPFLNAASQDLLELAQDNEKRICTLEQKVGM